MGQFDGARSGDAADQELGTEGVAFEAELGVVKLHVAADEDQVFACADAEVGVGGVDRAGALGADEAVGFAFDGEEGGGDRGVGGAELAAVGEADRVDGGGGEGACQVEVVAGAKEDAVGVEQEDVGVAGGLEGAVEGGNVGLANSGDAEEDVFYAGIDGEVGDRAVGEGELAEAVEEVGACCCAGGDDAGSGAGGGAAVDEGADRVVGGDLGEGGLAGGEEGADRDEAGRLSHFWDIEHGKYTLGTNNWLWEVYRCGGTGFIKQYVFLAVLRGIVGLLRSF